MKFYKKTWFILLMLLVFAPVGIALMWWQKRTWNKVLKAIVSFVAGFVFLVAFSSQASTENLASPTTSGIVAYANSSQNTETYTETFKTTTITKPTTSISTTISTTTTEPISEQTTTATPTESSTSSKQVAPDITGEMNVHFLDVGQAAATLFEIGDKVLMIDGGDRETSSFVVSYLKTIGIKQIDVMIATHYDADHINGLVGALHVFPVDQVYDANYAGTSRVYNSFKSIIAEKGISENVPGIGQSISVGDAKVTFVAPREYGHSKVNDDSICVRIQFGKTSFFISGDPSADAEQQILYQKLKSDVFLAVHHGSNGSNSKTLLANVDPDTVVISVGADNSYGHPGDNTLNRIRNTGADLYRTDKQGTIIATSDGETISWSQKPCNDFSPGSVATATEPKATTTVINPPPVISDGSKTTYVLNTNTGKFHVPSCRYVSQIKESNRQDVTMTREDIISQGFEPCGSCHP